MIASGVEKCQDDSMWMCKVGISCKLKVSLRPISGWQFNEMLRSFSIHIFRHDGDIFPERFVYYGRKKFVYKNKEPFRPADVDLFFPPADGVNNYPGHPLGAVKVHPCFFRHFQESIGLGGLGSPRRNIGDPDAAPLYFPAKALCVSPHRALVCRVYAEVWKGESTEYGAYVDYTARFSWKPATYRHMM